MQTPIFDFVRRYAASDACRLHMPGHKGISALGVEPLDITEIDGADSLYEAKGIIRESEKHAGALFGAETFYSTEGSSLAIRAMLYLAVKNAAERGEKTKVLAGRNAHKTFLSAVALLDIEVEWLSPEGGSYLACAIDLSALEERLKTGAFTALYLTSPDYLGNTVDVAAISVLCHRYGVLLLVDNAHGAYLKFLPESRHPIDLGADLCCDSAHKTLPALTGGAYLHVSHTVSPFFAPRVKEALSLFGSTSPSYLILQSLDLVNAYLSSGYADRLATFVAVLDDARHALSSAGFVLCGDEPLKLTLAPKSFGYEGAELAAILEEYGFLCEFSDPDFTVMMFTPEVGAEAVRRLVNCLLNLPRRAPVLDAAPVLTPLSGVLSPREALLAPTEEIDCAQCAGRVLAAPSVACPPAVPIAVCGERMTADTAAAFAYYGIPHCTVVKE